MNTMAEKLGSLGPELSVLIGACACIALGLSSRMAMRRLSAWAAAVALIVAGALAWAGSAAPTPEQVLTAQGEPLENMAGYVKVAVAGMGLILVMLMAHVPSQLAETQVVASGPDSFDAAHTMHGEFFAFLLFALIGAMLCASATDLVWLFLALELTSLPTYILVATSRNRSVTQEAAVKYFFLGALSAAIFLYGFALIYGATGATEFVQIRRAVAESQGPSALMTTGLVLAMVGICFKIAAVPMHFYTADVYQGAATPVTAALAFVPKTAGFVSLIALLGLVNWDLPQPVTWLLWALAALTMTLGNVLGLLQGNVKRVLAYSSIAHSGYMLVGLLAGAASAQNDPTLHNGVAAVLFYLVGYGAATLAAFGVLSCLQQRGEEAQDYDDIAGLSTRYPGLAAILLIAVLSLLGFPLTVGFVGKVYLFGSAVAHGFLPLVVIAVLNSAISAVYYLRIVGACYWGQSTKPAELIGAVAPRIGAGISAVAVVALFLAGGLLVNAARDASPKRFSSSALSEQVEDTASQSPTAVKNGGGK